MQNHLYLIYLLDEIRLVFHYQNHYKRFPYQKTIEINPVYDLVILHEKQLAHFDYQLFKWEMPHSC